MGSTFLNNFHALIIKIKLQLVFLSFKLENCCYINLLLIILYTLGLLEDIQ